jgi:cbb3-type cytochrome oxidase subunit 3
MILFLGVVFWAFRRRNKKRFEQDAMIPFKDDNGG